MPVIEGRLDGTGKRVAIVASRYNHVITRRLFEGAVKRLAELGCTQVDEVWVPGAFELPLAAQALAEGASHDGIIAIGVVIRGDTPHFDYVCRSVTDGIADVGLSAGLPIAFCVLTTETVEQALVRAVTPGEEGSNKGAEAAEVVVEMMDLMHQLGPEA
jgi:6,7-dimethyl-8-ribityllumazine synthase